MALAQIRFIDKDKDKAKFFATLRQRVDAYFKENNLSKHYNAEMVIKTIVLIAAYLLPFLALVIFQPPFGISLIIWTVMGLSCAGIGMSVMHDANHGAYSANSKVNKWLGHTLNILGGSVFNWKMQHNILHHTYTNVISHDYDIQDKAALLRFSPHTPVKKIHRMQSLYALLFYGILTLYWALLKDFMQFAKYKKEGLNSNTRAQNNKLLVKMVIDKILYFFVFLFVPIYAGLPVGEVIYGFLFMHFLAGVILTVVFQLAHTVEGTTHPVANESGTIENNWAVHQMNTTVNFARHNKLISWYVGGLNFQVEHHLFPNICHVHYPKITGIVKSTAEEFGVPYLENETLSDAINSHFETLKRFGKLPDINEALA